MSESIRSAVKHFPQLSYLSKKSPHEKEITVWYYYHISYLASHFRIFPIHQNRLRSVSPPPPPPLPAAGGTLTDPTFGTALLRVTDANDGAQNYHSYSY
ncbi:MAG: hypothetical protein HY063_08930 [Bacteroidetes bacterium]|nr:hypothetical protein [Bacteroidota bacterium]